jgi:hypothetical protein
MKIWNSFGDAPLLNLRPNFPNPNINIGLNKFFALTSNLIDIEL